MANYNQSEAYDLSIFENNSAAAPKQGEQKKVVTKQGRHNNVIELPKDKLEKNRKRHAHSLSMGAFICSLFAMLAIVGYVVYGQVQLNELTTQTTKAEKMLEEQKSVNTQLKMQSNAKMTLSDVESYAKNKLGMSKIGRNQISYITLTNGDKGTVVKIGTQKNLLSKVWEFFEGLLS